MMVEMNGSYFRASILQIDFEPAPYDGLSYPLKKVPNWVLSDESKRQLNYKQFPSDKLIDLPPYDLSVMQIPASDLEWGNSEHDTIRNIQITYPVPYAGNYNLDGKEGSGSHPAVDIKALQGTPVYAIGNGKVVKVSLSDDGFGKHIVIYHKDFPDPSDASRKVDLYSSYSHLSSIAVSENEIVTKGQIIGEVGDTGFATTDHLHFQIDKADAPWHPYWPFTYKDASDAGLTFVDAVNAGLGKDNLYAYTINPMKYLSKYLAPSTLESPISSEPPELPEETSSLSTASEQTPVISADESSSFDSSDMEKVEELTLSNEPKYQGPTNVSDFQFITDIFFLVGNNYPINIQAFNSAGNPVSEPKFQSLRVHLSNPSLGSIEPSEISIRDFSNSKAAFIFTPTQEGKTRFILELDEGGSFESIEVESRLLFKGVKKFLFEHDGSFEPNVREEVRVIALDEDGKRTPYYNLSNKAYLKVVSGKAKLSKDSLNQTDFIDGLATFYFTAESSAEIVLNISNFSIHGSKSEPLAYKVFSDVSFNHKNVQAIAYLKENGIVGGYDDGTFKPNAKVSRAEALKMIFEASNQTTSENVSLNFKDISQGVWFEKYVATAYNLNIVSGYNDGTFRPSNNVTRAEFLKMILSAFKIDVDPLVAQKPYEDVEVSAWFAPYVQYAKDQGFVSVSGKLFNPHAAISRGEVAEILYRILMNQ